MCVTYYLEYIMPFLKKYFIYIYIYIYIYILRTKIRRMTNVRLCCCLFFKTEDNPSFKLFSWNKSLKALLFIGLLSLFSSSSLSMSVLMSLVSSSSLIMSVLSTKYIYRNSKIILSFKIYNLSRKTKCVAIPKLPKNFSLLLEISCIS